MASLPERARQKRAPLGSSGRQALAAVGATSGDDLAAALGRHAGAVAMTALTHQLAGLIGSLHGPSPGPCSAGQAQLSRESRCQPGLSCKKGPRRPVRQRRSRAYGGWGSPSQWRNACAARSQQRFLPQTCTPRPKRRYSAREVGEGRLTRQPGQVRKEAAVTRPNGSSSNLLLQRTHWQRLKCAHRAFLTFLTRSRPPMAERR